jgi:hypothetical protein
MVCDGSAAKRPMSPHAATNHHRKPPVADTGLVGTTLIVVTLLALAVYPEDIPHSNGSTWVSPSAGRFRVPRVIGALPTSRVECGGA